MYMRKEGVMSDNQQSRKWNLTINNPIDYGWTHEKLNNTLQKIASMIYYCISDEIGGEKQTFHTHIYFATKNPKPFTTIKNTFPEAHIEKANGTSSENRDYVFKEGKWLDSEKGTTNLRDTHEEWGEMPIEKQGSRSDLNNLYEMIKDGYTNYQILEEDPKYMLKLDKIDKARKTYLEEQYKNKWRDVKVTYIWGTTGAGKTRGVKEKYGYSNVYSVTDYAHPFDGYNGQDVILFEEFRSNLKIGDMLQFLDGYPIDLPCRYANKVACFTKVFFCTNIDIKDQYRDVKYDYPETWKAFLRRINYIKMYTAPDEYIIMDTNSYMNDIHVVFDNPFEGKQETLFYKNK